MRSMTGDDGRPIPAERWDRQYRDGRWRFLDSPEEFAHYRAVAGYIRRYSSFPTILDAGRGHGRLAELLAEGSYRSYLGVDFSGEAIAQAARLTGKRVRFRIADLNRWRPRRRFSVIVFCESLNYAIHPVATLRDYAGALEPGGSIVVSLYRHPNHERIWTDAAAFFRTLHTSVVTDDRTRSWRVGVLQPKAAAVRRHPLCPCLIPGAHSRYSGG